MQIEDLLALSFLGVAVVDRIYKVRLQRRGPVLTQLSANHNFVLDINHSALGGWCSTYRIMTRKIEERSNGSLLQVLQLPSVEVAR